MGESEVRSSSISKASVSCEECGGNPWKYRCPGCSILTCSIPCVKAHKGRTGCSGQKNRTQIVPLSQFNDDLLISDYNFLEDALRTTESARRMRSISGDSHPGFNMRKLGVLRKAAFRRKVRLFFLPAGMSKREKNQSRFNRRSNSIFWTVEWRFHSTDVVITDHNVDERKNLISIMGKHLQPTPWNNKLKPFCSEPVETLKFFLKKNSRDPNSPFLQLNSEAPLGEQTMGLTVVEYPIILVYLPTKNPNFHVEVFHRSSPVKRQPSPSGIEGNFFKEEVEDDCTPGSTRVLDLGSAGVTTSLAVLPAGEDADLAETMALVNSAEDGGFDFEQELMRDAYSDLLGEMNPDDFLCFDHVFGEDCEGEPLEEGEILEFC